MSHSKSLLALAIAGLTFANISYAEQGWQGDAELGYVLTTGNTDTETGHGKFSVQNTRDALVTALKLEALTGKSEQVTNKEKYNAEFKLDYNFAEATYFTSQLAYENDRFSGFSYQATFSAGLGHKFLNSDTYKLALEAGPGHRRDRIEEDGSIKQETIGRLALDFGWKLSENAEFTENFSIEGGESNQIYKSEAAIKSTLVGSLAMKISHQAKYIQNVPEGSSRRDDVFGVTLVYGF